MASLVNLLRPSSLLSDPLPADVGPDNSAQNYPRSVITGVIPSSSPSFVSFLTPLARSAAELDRVWPDGRAPAPAILTRSVNPAPAQYSTLHVIVDRVVSDWLTLTTFNRHDAVALLRACLRALAIGGAAPIKLQQYDGYRVDGCAYGVAQQAGRMHYLIQLHGSVAHQLLADLVLIAPDLLRSMKCTRFDVKLDVSYSADQVRFSDIYNYLVDPEHDHIWRGLRRGPRPALRAFVNDSGLDTLYIGARSSVRMQRIYVKEVGDQKLTRWEVEFKEELAAATWAAVLAGGVAVLPAILAGEVASVPLESFLPLIYDRLNHPAERLTLVADRSDADRTLLWLHESVSPAVNRLNAIGGRPASRVTRWVEEINERLHRRGVRPLL